MAHLGFDLRIREKTLAQFRHLRRNRSDRLRRFGHFLRGLPLAAHQPDDRDGDENEQNGHAGGPLFHAAPQLREIVAQFKHAGLECIATR